MDVNTFKEKFDNLVYPNQSNMVREAIKDVEMNFIGTMSQIEAEIERVKKEVEKEFKKLEDEYYDKRDVIEEEFKQCLFEDNGVENNPRRNKAYDFAYSHGRRSGLQEIECIFAELVEIITIEKEETDKE